MLQALRQHRRRLAGNFATLLATAWLSLALAPCAAAADVTAEASDSNALAMHHGATAGTHGTPSTDHACKHCQSTAESHCAAAGADCSPGIALLRGEAEHGKLKFVALPLALADALPSRSAVSGVTLPVASPPVPHPPFTRLYCRFRE